MKIPETSLGLFLCLERWQQWPERGKKKRRQRPIDGVGPLLIWESGRCGLGRGGAGRALTGVPPSGGKTVPCWWGSDRQPGGMEGKPCRGSVWLVAPSLAATVLIVTSAFTTALSSSNMMQAMYVSLFPSSHIEQQNDEIVQFTLCNPVYRKPYFMSSIESEILYWWFYAKSWKPVCSFTLSYGLN